MKSNSELLKEFLEEDTPQRLEDVKDSLFRFMSMAAQNQDNFVTDSDMNNIHTLYDFLSNLHSPKESINKINNNKFSEN